MVKGLSPNSLSSLVPQSIGSITPMASVGLKIIEFLNVEPNFIKSLSFLWSLENGTNYQLKYEMKIHSRVLSTI